MTKAEIEAENKKLRAIIYKTYDSLPSVLDSDNFDVGEVDFDDLHAAMNAADRLGVFSKKEKAHAR